MLKKDFKDYDSPDYLKDVLIIKELFFDFLK